MVAKKSKSKKAPFDGLATFDFRGVTERFVRVMVRMGASKAEILEAVKHAKATESLPKSSQVVPGTTAHWARPLARWADDPRFLNSEGRPMDLPFAGKKKSFSELVGLVLPGENPALCRDVLLASKSIIRLRSGKLRWRYRDALWRQQNGTSKRSASETIFIEDFLDQVKSVLTCTEANLTRKISERGLYQRTVSGFALAQADVPEFERVLDIHGMSFLETMDDWLAHHSQKPGAIHQSGLVSPMIGVFVTTDSVSPASSTAKLRKKTPAVRKRR